MTYTYSVSMELQTAPSQISLGARLQLKDERGVRHTGTQNDIAALQTASPAAITTTPPLPTIPLTTASVPCPLPPLLVVVFPPAVVICCVPFVKVESFFDIMFHGRGLGSNLSLNSDHGLNSVS